MKNSLTFFGKTLLWLTWLYPFIRVFIILPISWLEDYVGGEKTKILLDGAKYIHGGDLVSEIVGGVYMIYFVLSVGAYLFWHWRKNMRIGWGQRAALALVTFYNFFNIYLMHLVATNGHIQWLNN